MAPTNTTSTGPAWTVTAQQEQTVIGPTGNAVDVMRVTFQLADGTQGSVNVPLSNYNADSARAAIAAKAQQLFDVQSLSN